LLDGEEILAIWHDVPEKGRTIAHLLLQPAVGMSLAATLGDLEFLRRSCWTLATGIVVALIVSLILGMFLDIDPSAPALAARTRVELSDVAVALAAGAAGAIAYTSGSVNPVIGVMVAVALIPALAATGLLLGAGHMAEGWGAALLTLTNVISINLAGIAAFLLRNVRPRTL